MKQQMLAGDLRNKKPHDIRFVFHPLYLWLGGFVLFVILFLSFAQIVITKPAIFNRVGSISLIAAKADGNDITEQTEFKTSDVIKAVVEYTGAQQGVEVTLVFARLSSEAKVRNGREVLSQVSVPFTNQQGKKTYFFPAFEKKPGNYEITLQSDGDIVSKTTIQIRNE